MTDLPEPVERATERLFCALSSARGSRILHPRGIAYRAAVDVGDGIPGTRALPAGAQLAGVARFSRGLGLPAGAPDFLGLALSLESGQDLLLTTSAARPPLRFVPLPARSFFGPTYTTLLPLAVERRLVLVGARVYGAASPHRDAWEELAAAEQDGIRVELLVAEPFASWRRIASVSTTERVAPDEARLLFFDPWRCGGGLVPWSWVNDLRAPAYRGSRRGRAAARAVRPGQRTDGRPAESDPGG